MKKLLLKCILVVLLGLGVRVEISAQNISPYLIGNNYWYPGSNTADLMKVGGVMEKAGFQYIRIGGFGANSYSLTNVVSYIDIIRSMGAEPQVQVPYNFTDQQAINMITYINNTMNRNIKFWSIGNEPEHPKGGNLPIATVASYTRRIAKALKSVDPTIKVIALELSGYRSDYMAAMIGGSDD
ncbi:MAG: glycoside hydrolase family 44 protein, partial [Cytophagales bacterium]|nr:glycoside hydrolase family 44 protein [Cytophagales bacterium]